MTVALGQRAAPLLLSVLLQGWQLPRSSAARSDNSCSLSAAEGACQPQEDKKAEVIYSCVIKWLLCLPAALVAVQMALL